jgi:two-component system, NtrC family, response regulator AtoC
MNMEAAWSGERSAGCATQSADIQRHHSGRLELVIVDQRSVTRRGLTPPGTLRIGRADECDVVLQDPAASRRHALLHVAGELGIEDLESRNGTLLRGVRLCPRRLTRFHPGDAVQIGGAILFVQGELREEGRPLGAAETNFSLPAVSEAKNGAEMRAVRDWIARVSPSQLTVLVSGETGVGKEVVADAIHRASGARSRKPLLRINCAALSPALLESELFGYERGAFTGASRDKRGLFEAADGGTAFLDEVGELPLEAQAKLLRVLETRDVVRVGGVKPRHVDVRFIAATNRDLRAAVARGVFREDLFFRLHVASIVVPPLRRRPAELESLSTHFIDAFCRQMDRPAVVLAPDALERLRRHPWPGNIRELRNALECAVLRAKGESIEAADLPPEIGVATALPTLDSAPPDPKSLLPPIGESAAPFLSEPKRTERDRIVRALAECHGNQTRAAERLTMPRRTLVAKLSAYDIPRPRTPRSDREH